jgi:SAM-dependent methyltransferase
LAQIYEDKSGLKKIISRPAIYNLIQWAAGARMYRNRLVRDYIKPFEGCRILDIGCGTGEFVEFIGLHCSKFTYFGFDAEASYIAHAKELSADKPHVHFFHRILMEEDTSEFNDFDIVLAMGVMHHMSDNVALSLLRTARKTLKPNGRLITFDPGKFHDSNVIERFFVRHDRGRNIRPPEHYERLIRQVFASCQANLPELTYFPCRNVVFECVNV